MDARFWIVVVPLWFLVLVNILISLLPVAPWARVRGWRIARILSVAMLVLLALPLTLNVLARGHRRIGILDTSSDAFLILEFTLDGLGILAALSMSFLLFVRTPEVARMLHVPPRLYGWLYNRDINESSQVVSSPQPLPGDDR